MANVTLIEKEDNGVIYVQIQSLPDVVRNRIGCSKLTDRSKMKCLFECCARFEEYIEKQHFLTVAGDLING